MGAEVHSISVPRAWPCLLHSKFTEIHTWWVNEWMSYQLCFPGAIIKSSLIQPQCAEVALRQTLTQPGGDRCLQTTLSLMGEREPPVWRGAAEHGSGCPVCIPSPALVKRNCLPPTILLPKEGSEALTQDQDQAVQASGILRFCCPQDGNLESYREACWG